MQISFWKEPETDTRQADSLEILRERYIEDGRRVTEELSAGDNVLAVWLSGPFDTARVQPTSDLHMSVLVDGVSHLQYKHRLPAFSPVGRRLEIAFLPLNYLHSIVENGYASWNHVYDMHKLCDIEILFEKANHLSLLKERIPEVRPKQIFVGRQLSLLRDGLQRLDNLRQAGQYRECLLQARNLLLSCTKIFLIAGQRELFSKISHLYPALTKLSEQSPVAHVERIYQGESFSESQVEELLMKVNTFIKSLFKWKIECDDDSN